MGVCYLVPEVWHGLGNSSKISNSEHFNPSNFALPVTFLALPYE
jgi:hypothetical protein